MSDTIRCDIVSAHKEIFSGQVSLCIATGAIGELGIAPRHAPLMTTLNPGPVRLIMQDGEEILFFVSGGILEVMPHLVTVLADTAIRAADIDEAAAKQAKAEAERELMTHAGKMEIAEARVKLAEALAKLEALERLRERARVRR